MQIWPRLLGHPHLNYSDWPLLGSEISARNPLLSPTLAQILKLCKKTLSLMHPHRLRLPQSRRGPSQDPLGGRHEGVQYVLHRMVLLHWHVLQHICSLQCGTNTSPARSAGGPTTSQAGPSASSPMITPRMRHQPHFCLGFQTRPQRRHVGIDINTFAFQPCQNPHRQLRPRRPRHLGRISSNRLKLHMKDLGNHSKRLAF